MLSLVQVLFRLQHPVAGAADRPRGGAQPRPARHAREGRGGQTVSADYLLAWNSEIIIIYSTCPKSPRDVHGSKGVRNLLSGNKNK